MGALVDPRSAGYIYNRATGTRVGSGQHANGRVLDSARFDKLCSDEGGTGAIIGGTGDRACATADLPLAEESYRGEAYVYNAAGTIIAVGDTGWWW